MGNISSSLYVLNSDKSKFNAGIDIYVMDGKQLNISLFPCNIGSLLLTVVRNFLLKMYIQWFQKCLYI